MTKEMETKNVVETKEEVVAEEKRKVITIELPTKKEVLDGVKKAGKGLATLALGVGAGVTGMKLFNDRKDDYEEDIIEVDPIDVVEETDE